ncbi:hypothetical protein SNE40_001616 [Patella caerulea]|uniref:Uncharacterized protein n=1 Tax=Patella caerulea TaxID=87958 RepID=A0AAN8KEA4_PATCE
MVPKYTSSACQTDTVYKDSLDKACQTNEEDFPSTLTFDDHHYCEKSNLSNEILKLNKMSFKRGHGRA